MTRRRYSEARLASVSGREQSFGAHNAHSLAGHMVHAIDGYGGVSTANDAAPIDDTDCTCSCIGPATQRLDPRRCVACGRPGGRSVSGT